MEPGSACLQPAGTVKGAPVQVPFPSGSVASGAVGLLTVSAASKPGWQCSTGTDGSLTHTSTREMPSRSLSAVTRAVPMGFLSVAEVSRVRSIAASFCLPSCTVASCFSTAV